MNYDLKTAADRLQKNINEVPAKFLSFTEETLLKERAPGKWSRKQILGHLIDSAANNHHRFVKAQFEKEPFTVVPYEQEEWVNAQKYNEIDTKYLVELWKIYNQHIHWIISNYPEKKLNVKCRSIDGRETPGNVFLLIKDYVDHMDHHLNQIFNQ
jgi:hypothetical protein